MIYRIYADSQLLYSPELSTEGYDAIDPKLTVELNKAGSLEFTMTPNNVLYNSLSKLSTDIYVEYGDERIWWGRILNDEKDFYNRKQVYCEGALSFLNDGVIRPFKKTNTSARDYLKYYLDQYNAQVEAKRQIFLKDEDCDITNTFSYEEKDYKSPIELINDTLLNQFGGYVSVYKSPTDGKFYLKWKSQSGSLSSQIIEFGVNMLDLTEHIDATDVFTVLIPLGKSNNNARATISSVNNGKDYLESETAIGIFGKIWRTQTFDDISDANQLKTAGQNYLDANIEMAVTLSVNAVDMHWVEGEATERFKLGDSIRVLSLPHGLDTNFACSKIELNLSDPSDIQYTLGANSKGLTDQQIDQSKATGNAYTVAENAQSQIDQAVIDISGDFVSVSDFNTFQSTVSNQFTQINNKIASVYRVKGSVANYAALPANPETGDVYNLLDNGANYVWTGSEWDKLSETVDFSGTVDVDLTELEE